MVQKGTKLNKSLCTNHIDSIHTHLYQISQALVNQYQKEQDSGDTAGTHFICSFAVMLGANLHVLLRCANDNEMFKLEN